MDLMNASIPSTAIPIKRKGSSNNQTMGYRRRAKNARGQQKINNSNQSKNLRIFLSFFYTPTSILFMTTLIYFMLLIGVEE
jgi:hypothetical protein